MLNYYGLDSRINKNTKYHFILADRFLLIKLIHCVLCRLYLGVPRLVTRTYLRLLEDFLMMIKAL